ncbi:MAG: carbon storage regulator [Pirellulales bacterium]
MLVLSRRESERIRLGDSIVVTVVRVSGDKVRLGIEAPADVAVLREELKPHAAAARSAANSLRCRFASIPLGTQPAGKRAGRDGRFKLTDADWVEAGLSWSVAWVEAGLS